MPRAIHYQGHAVCADQIREQNRETMSEAEVAEIYEKGPALILEDERCCAEYLHQGDLTKMLQNKLDLVFMSECHSELAAKIFLDSGASHVIGVKNNISDAAVSKFTSTFYKNLWQDSSTICQSFHTALNSMPQKSDFFLLSNHPDS